MVSSPTTLQCVGDIERLNTMVSAPRRISA
jgi:hypothetical protein